MKKTEPSKERCHTCSKGKQAQQGCSRVECPKRKQLTATHVRERKYTPPEN